MNQPSAAPPPFRRLRGYAFDPSLSTQLETAVVNEVVFRVPWERRREEIVSESGEKETVGTLEPGPVGEYLEVVDFDPASGCFYAPVDLDDPHLLAQDGLAPSEGNPQFHQQMVYAVAMTTIRNFEHALGRKALWAPRDRFRRADGAAAPPPDEADDTPGDGDDGPSAGAAASPPDAAEAGSPPEKVPPFEYVPRLRIYPHALRQANAFYSPDKKALLFGYFPAGESDPGQHYPGGMVFTCLSHDIVAHETTHALLDGMHRRFVEPTHPDALAFHEAFADIVALFQHFTFPEVLRHQIARTRGDLASQSLLGELAQQFGRAMGSYGALRDAIGRVNPETKRWEPLKPDPDDYRTVTEPHARGAILVAAVFDAFISIYKTRVGDLFRIATGGTGVLSPGALHPDLVNRLAGEASKTAQHVLNMCVRALDYCPPVDITFGDYLRALVTADYELVRDDDRGYRVAFIEAFRRRGIYPRDVRTLSEDTLRWKASHQDDVRCDWGPICTLLRRFVEENGYLGFPAFPPPEAFDRPGVDWARASERERMWHAMEHYGSRLNRVINREMDRAALQRLSGLWLRGKGEPADDGEEAPPGLRFSADEGDPAVRRPKFEVHAIRPSQRVGPDGGLLNEVVISITQRRAARLREDVPKGETETFWFRGGVTLILDLETQQLRYAVVKRINSANRLRREREFRATGTVSSLRATYFGRPDLKREPFAFLHASHEQEP